MGASGWLNPGLLPKDQVLYAHGANEGNASVCPSLQNALQLDSQGTRKELRIEETERAEAQCLALDLLESSGPYEGIRLPDGMLAV